jgi:hypothetical protein
MKYYFYDCSIREILSTKIISQLVSEDYTKTEYTHVNSKNQYIA